MTVNTNIPTITFGGETITITSLYSDCDLILEFKGRKILLSQIKQFIDIPDFKAKRLIMGVDPDNRVPISENHNGDIKIGCISDTKENFYNLFKNLTKDEQTHSRQLHGSNSNY